jgi:hypothetical protein
VGSIPSPGVVHFTHFTHFGFPILWLWKLFQKHVVRTKFYFFTFCLEMASYVLASSFFLFHFFVTPKATSARFKWSVVLSTILCLLYNKMKNKKYHTCQHNSKIPHCQHNSKIPHCKHNSKIPHCQHNSKIPHCQHNSKIPHCKHNSKIPHCQHNSKISHCQHNSKIPHCQHNSKT